MNWEYKNYPEHNLDEADYFKTHADKFKVVVDLVSKEKPSKILDIGAGVGTVYSLLPSLEGCEIHALEIVQDYVDVLEERGIHAHVFDLDKEEAFPFQDETFDLVLCDSMLEHTLNPLYMLNESRRVLKKGGTFIVIVPNSTSIRRRWDQLRGRNIFYPLIDNLFTQSYLQRCSVFYSETEIRKYIGKLFSIEKISFIDETYHDPNSLSTSIFRIISARRPSLRDVLVMIGKKT